MTTKAHKLLTGTDLHEPKGVETATAGQVYISDGVGSGSWQTINTTISFSTGDVKLTYKTVPDTGWVMLNDTTIGDASSGATGRANADCSALFQVLWSVTSDTFSPVSGGRGVSGAADFAAHKTLRLPFALGRALAISGLGAGFSTTRILGSFLGAEANTATLTSANIPTLTSVNGAQNISVLTTSSTIADGYTTNNGSLPNTGPFYVPYSNIGPLTLSQKASSGANSISVTYTNASPTAISLSSYQPTTFLNAMLKL